MTLIHFLVRILLKINSKSLSEKLMNPNNPNPESMKANLYTKSRGIVLMLLFLTFAFHSYSQQVTRNVTASNGTYIGFYEFKPYNYNANPTRKYPLIIFLHGIGERGNGTTELPRVLTWAIPNYCANGATMTFNVNGQEESFLTLSPQLSLSWGNWQPFYVEEMIKWAKQTMRVDTNRIYLTGLSLGGGGVWKYATSSAAAAKSLAAIAPVCGTCDYTNFCNIAQNRVGVWAFHAQDDGTVGVGCTFNAINQINACSPVVKPRQSIYPDGGHFIWNRSFDTTHNIHTPNMYEWLLSHDRSLPPPANALPIADAGPDKSIGLPISTTTLTGLASSDPDGAIASYYWEQIGGPNWTPLSSNQTATITVNSLNQQGVYTYKMTVTDIAGATDLDTVSINVFPPGGYNAPPIANAGPDQTITTNSAVLNSYGTTDTDGTITSFTWSKVSGPAQGTVTNQNYAVANGVSLVGGVYKFRLFVTDNLGGVDDDTVQITVNLPGPTNQPPVANAGTDITITLPTSSTTLNGSGSTDADGSINNYTWTKIAGPSSYTISNSFAANTGIGSLTQGTYSFRLVVTDNSGSTDDDTVNVVVNAAPPPPPPANQPPVANAGTDITITLPTSSTTLNGSGSTDADGTINTYAWTKIAGPATYTIANASTASTGLSNLVQGTYSFRLVVTDNSGATDDDTVNVVVNAAPLPPPPPANQPPVANAGTDITITLPTSSTTLNGSGSTDADGTINTYAWTKTSGPASYTIVNPASVNTALNNLTEGVYTFRLTVVDNAGASATDDVTVTVAPQPNAGPVANAGNDIEITLPINRANLDGSNSSDPDGSIISYTWVRATGPGAVTIVNSNTSRPSVDGLSQGLYEFELTVTDNRGAVAKDRVLVKVNKKPNAKPIAKANKDTSVALTSAKARLSGTESVDTDGAIVAYKWTQVSGPAIAAVVSPATVETEVLNLQEGVYEFELAVTDDEGDIATTTVRVSVINAFRYSKLFKIYPNPAKEVIQLQLIDDAKGRCRVFIYDVKGRSVLETEFSKDQSMLTKAIDVSKLKPGMYYLQVLESDGSRIMRQFVKH
ncbi:MAG: T9SS C-terminal target domain-containing protein [Sphingobacteriales bacterium]|nr:MAG: T9SS C-terminal target domain-containing protein [Sphingobacteriales bacterium]